MSLHPKAQVEAGEYLAERVSTGVQVIVTTHSHYFLQGVLKSIRSGLLSHENVAVLNCQKTRYGTKVERLDIDEDGRIEAWIRSFSAVDDYLIQDWFESLPQGQGHE